MSRSNWWLSSSSRLSMRTYLRFRPGSLKTYSRKARRCVKSSRASSTTTTRPIWRRFQRPRHSIWTQPRCRILMIWVMILLLRAISLSQLTTPIQMIQRLSEPTWRRTWRPIKLWRSSNFFQMRWSQKASWRWRRSARSGASTISKRQKSEKPPSRHSISSKLTEWYQKIRMPRPRKRRKTREQKRMLPI